MRYWLLLALLAGCRGHSPKRIKVSDALSRIPQTPTDRTRRWAGPAPVLRESSVVVFWLAGSDTLARDQAADLLDDFRYYTSKSASFFVDWDIQMVGTNSDTVYVELEDGTRRLIMLSGLEYPFGYLLVEPGTAEQILTGISTDEELIDAATDYFGLGEDETPQAVAKN
jgi:hypothetical protein